MFVPVVAHQRGADRLDGGMTGHIAEGCQHVGIAFTRHNGSDDQPLPLTQISAQGGNLGIRAEAAAQQAIGMELAASLTSVLRPGTFLA